MERYTFDARWRYAAGVGGYDTGAWTSFAHTVLVDMRERLRRSARPNRIFDVALGAAKQAGLIGRRRVLDSTPLYDAVATMDTVTLIRSAIRGLLKVADDELVGELRAVLRSGDDYASAAKPQIDWDDESASCRADRQPRQGRLRVGDGAVGPAARPGGQRGGVPAGHGARTGPRRARRRRVLHRPGCCPWPGDLDG